MPNDIWGRAEPSLFHHQFNASAAGALSQLVNDPTGFNVNLKTRSHGGDLIRGQLSSVAIPPVIRIPGAHFLPTNATAVARIELLVTGFDVGSRVLINGQEVSATLSQSGLDGGRLFVDIPPEMRASAGTLILWWSRETGQYHVVRPVSRRPFRRSSHRG
jgi:hypothetical protein